MTDSTATLNARYIIRQKTLKRLGFATYDDYLASELWATVKAKAMARANGCCKLCGEEAYTAHHVDYTRQAMLGLDGERVIAICQSCHYKVEFDRNGTKLLDSNRIGGKAWGITQFKRGRKRLRVKCRCCGNAPKELGRNDICLKCYKAHGPRVHQLADQRST